MSDARSIPKTDQREYLVIACGKKCKNHPEEKWVSVDPSDGAKPDIIKYVENLEPDDFKGNNKFKIIFVEGITGGLSSGRFKKLQQFMHDNSALIIDQGSFSTILPGNNAIESNITNFVTVRTWCIVTIGNSDLEAACHVMLTDLLNKSSLESKERITKRVGLILKEIKNTQKEYQEYKIDPLLISAIAHLKVYVSERKDRTLRNWFKDDDYNKMYEDIKNAIVEFSLGKLSKDKLLANINEWQIKLPSSEAKPYKLTYDKLNAVLNNVIAAITYYDERRSPKLEVKKYPPKLP